GMGRSAAARAPPDACGRHHGLLRLGARGATAQGRGDERAAAGDGRHAQFRPMQPRPADLGGAETHRHRAAVRAAVRAARVGGSSALLSLFPTRQDSIRDLDSICLWNPLRGRLVRTPFTRGKCENAAPTSWIESIASFATVRDWVSFDSRWDTWA